MSGIANLTGSDDFKHVVFFLQPSNEKPQLRGQEKVFPPFQFIVIILFLVGVRFGVYLPCNEFSRRMMFPLYRLFFDFWSNWLMPNIYGVAKIFGTTAD